MSITSLIFLFFFLPVSLIIYHMVRDDIKEYVLLGISLLFYAFGSIEFLPLFILALTITVLVGRIITKTVNMIMRRVLLVMGIILNVGLLGYYKYWNFILESWGIVTSHEVILKEIALPLGISFFTFKSISYLADIFNNKVSLSEKPFHDALYLSFFAQIQSGPLTRYSELTFNVENRKTLFVDGVYRFSIGFCKKVLIANVLSNITTEVFHSPFEHFSCAFAWLGSICYSLQLFFDFAGYSDMAVGISEMFGYRCMENFNYPYMTESISKFWRRWHISLSEWFRDYIYIPLGGQKIKINGKFILIYYVSGF